MIAKTIAFVLQNLPLVLFVLALVVGFLHRTPVRTSERLLAWLLLLSVGVSGVWAGFFHVAFPEISARSIGWQVSPFQFEIGVADAAIGIAAIVSFWRSLDFKAAVVWCIVLFDIGVAIGHVRDAVEAHNFAANNFGFLLAVTVAQAILLPWLLHAARQGRRW